jgi:aspartokinase/homoserine dehydrogenase 1
MHVLKFGGTSLSNAEHILHVSNIIVERSRKIRVGVVVSAIAGVTNYLADSVQKGLENFPSTELVIHFRNIHQEIITIIAEQKKNFAADELLLYLTDICHQYEALLFGIQLLQACPENVYTRILSLGERLSVRIMHNLLLTESRTIELLEARDFIKTKGNVSEGTPLIEEIKQRFAKLQQTSAHILLMPGFIASTMENQLMLLGRNGSDYSAALMAMGLQAERCEIWTDVDGIYTADPRLVVDAKLITEMSYGEAMELSFYGAKILHPKTITPLVIHHIPIWIGNSLNPQVPGTKIHHNVKEKNNDLIRGISCLDQIALINIYGPGMRGVSGIAARIFATVSKCNVSIVLITQSSSEYSICFCVAQHDAALIKEALNEEFALEIKAQLIDNVDVLMNQTIICIVGDQMRLRRGVAGKFFSALASADINVVAISQGSSERSISAVIDGKDKLSAMNIVHRFFFATVQSIEVFLLGPGAVGRQLLEQIRSRQKELLAQKVDIRVYGIADSKKTLLCEKGIELQNWQTQLQNSQQPNNLTHFFAHVHKEKLLNAILVDCTTSETIAESYPDAFKAKMHVITANKKANTKNLTYYETLRAIANEHSRRFLYETNVGAGLPIIDTLQNMLKSGDKLLNFSGILSGSLSFIFGLLEESVPFSQAVNIARDKKFTEPDPRDDLSGLDVARKLLILYREVGGELELNAIEIASLFPEDFDSSGSVDEFLQKLPKLNDYFANRLNHFKKNNQVMRYVGEISDNKCRVGIIGVDHSHPLLPIKGGENAFVFLTQRYSPIPLVIRGYGAGTEVTAAGVFADILRTIPITPRGYNYEN